MASAMPTPRWAAPVSGESIDRIGRTASEAFWAASVAPSGGRWRPATEAQARASLRRSPQRRLRAIAAANSNDGAGGASRDAGLGRWSRPVEDAGDTVRETHRAEPAVRAARRCAVCHRSSGFFARHRRTKWSSHCGAGGCSADSCGGIAIEDGDHQRAPAVGFECLASRQHLEQHQAEREHVGARVGLVHLRSVPAPCTAPCRG